MSQPGRAPRGWGDFAPRSVLARPGRCGVTRSGVWRPRVWAVPCPCRGSGTSAAMPHCLLWVCLAVWEASGDLPLIADNDAALTVNW